MPAPQPPVLEHGRLSELAGFLRDLTDLAVGLARKAAAAAHDQLDHPPEPTPRGAARPPDPHAVFVDYANLVRALVDAETRLAGTANPAPATRAPPILLRPADPRRDKIFPWVEKAIKNSADRTALRRAIAETLEELLADEAYKPQPLGEILFQICRRYELPWDVSKLPDEFLVPFPA